MTVSLSPALDWAFSLGKSPSTCVLFPSHLAGSTLGSASDAGAFHKPADLPYFQCQGVEVRQKSVKLTHPSRNTGSLNIRKEEQRQEGDRENDPVAFIFLQLLVQLDFVIFHLCFWLFHGRLNGSSLGEFFVLHSHSLFFGSGSRIPGPGSCFDGLF